MIPGGIETDKAPLSKHLDGSEVKLRGTKNLYVLARICFYRVLGGTGLILGGSKIQKMDFQKECWRF